MCVCVWGVCGKTDYTATLKVFRVRVLSVAIINVIMCVQLTCNVVTAQPSPSHLFVATPKTLTLNTLSVAV